MEKRILPPFAAVLLSGMLFSYYHFVCFFVAGGIITGVIFLCHCYNGCCAGDLADTHRTKKRFSLLLRGRYCRVKSGLVLCILLAGTFFFGAFRMQKVLGTGARAQGIFRENDTITLTGRLEKKEKKGEQTLLYIKGAVAHFDAKGIPAGEVVCYCGEDIAISDGCVSGAVRSASRADEAVSTLRVEGRLMEDVPIGADIVPIGALVRLRGTVLAMHIAENEGAFDEMAYLLSQGIFLKVSGKELSVLRIPRFALREHLYRLRLQMQQRYERLLYGEEAGLLSTMALGERSELAADVKTLFSEAGLSHILAISGLHISLVGMTLFGTMRKLRIPLLPSALCSGTVVFLYGWMTGMGIPATRAVGMYVVMLFGQAAGQEYDTLSALSLMAIVILVLHPTAAVGMSFAFSFGAVAGVVLVGQKLSELYYVCQRIRWERTYRITKTKRYRKRLSHRICAAMLASFGIQLATVPLVAWYFYAVPVYVLFLNILLLPFMGALLSFGLLGGMGIPGAQLLLYVCHLLLFWYEAAADVSLKIPFAKWVVGRPGIWQIVVYYAMLAGFLWLLFDWKEKMVRRHERRLAGGRIGVFRWLWGLACVSVLLFLLIGFHGRRDFAIEMLSVGQGDGIYIESGTGEHYFIDGGSTSEDELGKYTIQPFLYAKGIAGIDRWFITHMDIDHYSGFAWMLEHNYKVKTVVFAESVEKTEAFYELLSLCEEKGVAVEYMQTGDAVICEKGPAAGVFGRGRFGGGAEEKDGKGAGKEELRITCLAPDVPSPFSGTNENSLVLLLEKYSDTDGGEGFTSPEDGRGGNGVHNMIKKGSEGMLYCVFTGDIGEEQEQAILASKLFKEKLGKRKEGTGERTAYYGRENGAQAKNEVRENAEQGLYQDVLILKSAHHGSNSSNCSEWLSALSPELCIISAGKHNRYHHPGADAIARMDELEIPHLCTIDCGQISIFRKGERLEVESYLKE